MAKEFSRKFYRSKAWQECREGYIASVNGLCETCLKKGILTPGLIVHHTIKLTPQNIDNPEITLNHNLLRYECLECHNADEMGEHGGKVRRYVFVNGEVVPI
jgi:5-methylcytosine-specific restriction endonuclease McrA